MDVMLSSQTWTRSKKSLPLINLRIFVVLKRLDHDPLEEEGDANAGAIGRPPGDGLPRGQTEEFESCLVIESRLKLK